MFYYLRLILFIFLFCACRSVFFSLSFSPIFLRSPQILSFYRFTFLYLLFAFYILASFLFFLFCKTFLPSHCRILIFYFSRLSTFLSPLFNFFLFSRLLFVLTFVLVSFFLHLFLPFLYSMYTFISLFFIFFYFIHLYFCLTVLNLFHLSI